MVTDYSTVTELPGNRVTKQALQMIRARYSVAGRYCENKDVLEVGCGAGHGLGWLAQSGRRVTGGDLTRGMLRIAREHYGDRIGMIRLDAHSLPFREASFDTVVFFEALYYLERPDQFLRECCRVMNRDGVLVLCTVNKEWSDFNPSPFSTKYYSGPELFALLTENGFDTELYGAFPSTVDSLSGKAVSLIRRTAISLNLMPRSMKGKEWLKQMFYGGLSSLPPELDLDPGHPAPLTPISGDIPASDYKVLYAIGHLR